MDCKPVLKMDNSENLENGIQPVTRISKKKNETDFEPRKRKPEILKPGLNYR